MKKFNMTLLSIILLVAGYFMYVYLLNQFFNSDRCGEIIQQHVLLESEDQNKLVESVVAEDNEALNKQSTVTAEQIALVFPHPFTPLDKHVFYTPQERRDFFAQLGVEYLNKHIFDYAPILDIDAHTSAKYLGDIQEHNQLTNLYGQDIAMETLMPMSIRWIDQDIGHGVFAEEDMPAGGFVGIYGGVVRDRLLVGNKDYAWSYPGETLEGGRITLDAAEKGNELRLINDGKDPNCIVQYIIGYDNLWHVCYVACKDIKKGDQLLISYGPAYWDTRKYKYQELIGM